MLSAIDNIASFKKVYPFEKGVTIESKGDESKGHYSFFYLDYRRRTITYYGFENLYAALKKKYPKNSREPKTFFRLNKYNT